jgi:hypothetical protein
MRNNPMTRTSLRAGPAVLLGALVFAGVARTASAGVQNVPCERPFVFPKAAVNVVVLPYSVPPALRSSAGAGRKLSALVQLESLLAIAKFGSVGAVQLVGEPENDCTPEVVLAKLLQQRSGAAQALPPGAGLVLVWGRVFQSGNDLYLQSFVQFLRRDGAQPRQAVETVGVRVADQSLRGKFTAQAFACAPRRIAVSDLAAIDRQFASAMVVRSEPSESARGSSIPSEAPFSYWITDVQGPWMKIVASEGGPQGWILARAERPEWSLRRKMPELSFVEGITGYLRSRVAADLGQTSTAATTLAAAEPALEAYMREWRVGAVGLSDRPGDAGSTQMAVALPLQIRGAIPLLRGEASIQALQDARQAFARAVELAPYSADAKNLDVITRIVLAYTGRQPGLDPVSAATDLLEALGREPQNPLLLANLRSLYQLLLADPPATARPSDWTPLNASDRTEISRRLEAVQVLIARSAPAGRR